MLSFLVLRYDFFCTESCYHLGSKYSITVDQLRNLLELCGVRIVSNPADRLKSRQFSVIKLQPEADDGFEPWQITESEKLAESYGASTISHEWVIDCLWSYEIHPSKTQHFATGALITGKLLCVWQMCWQN